MSAPAAAPVLALVPPEPPRVVPAPAAPVTPATPADLARRARVRRVLAAACVTGALLPVPCVAAAAYLGEWVALGLVTSWVFLLPCGGFALLLSAALWRTRDDVLALVRVAVAFAVGTALIGPAARAGMQAYVSSHAAELDALAAERVAVLATLPPAELEAEIGRFPGTREAGDLRRLGLHSPYPVRGGVRFDTTAPFAPRLLYADPALDRWPSPCARERVTPIGGRWYLYECHDRAQYED